MSDFATVDNVATYTGKPRFVYTEAEQARITALLSDASDYIRAKAKTMGKDIDAMIAEDSTLSAVAKMVCINMVIRVLDATNAGTSSLLSQESQSANGYSWSGTYVNPGAKLYMSNAELKDLGLLKQKAGYTSFIPEDDE